MRCDIEEEIFVLGRRIFWAMRSGIGEHHHDGPVRLALLCPSKKGQRVIGNEIWEIILGIVPTVPDLVSINIEGVIVESWIPDQTIPLIPTHGDVVAIVLIEVFTKVPYNWEIQQLQKSFRVSSCMFCTLGSCKKIPEQKHNHLSRGSNLKGVYPAVFVLQHGWMPDALSCQSSNLLAPAIY